MIKRFLNTKIVEPEITLRVWELMVIIAIEICAGTMFVLGYTS